MTRIEGIRERCEMVDIVEEMREARLRWTVYVFRREEEEAARVASELEIEGQRGSGRPKWKWKDVVKADMEKGLVREDVKDEKMEDQDPSNTS